MRGPVCTEKNQQTGPLMLQKMVHNLGHSSQNVGFQSLVYGLSNENAQWSSLQNKSFILARKQMKRRRGQGFQKEEDTKVS